MKNRPDPRGDRNDALVDAWSFVHVCSTFFLTLWLGPLHAFVLVVMWEPFENLLLSPVLAKFGISFGHETMKNAMSDIVFDSIGLGLALLIL